MNLKNIIKGMNFGRKAEYELKKTGEDKGWQILAEGYRKTADELLSEVMKYLPNKALNRDRLYKLCNKNHWFDHGTVNQYQKLFDMLDDGASTHDLAMVIWVCSDTEKWTMEEIKEMLDLPIYAAVHHGESFFVGEYDEVENFVIEASEKDPDWEICALESKEDGE